MTTCKYTICAGGGRTLGRFYTMWGICFGITIVFVGISEANVVNPCSQIADGAIFHDRPGDFDDICYWVITTKQSANDSNTLCKKNGGTLANIPDKAADDVTQALMHSKRLQSCYIGIHDFTQNGVYQTYDSQLQWYRNWKSSEPDNMPEFHCVIAVAVVDGKTMEFIKYQWSDVYCRFPKNALCSKTIPAVKDFPSSVYQTLSELPRGNDVAKTDARSVIECATLCRYNGNCFSFYFKEPGCVLLNNDGVYGKQRMSWKYYRLLT